MAGGLIGGLTDAGVSETHAEYYAEAVRAAARSCHGARRGDRADEAEAIIRRHGAFDIEDRATSEERGLDGLHPTRSPSASTRSSDRRATASPGLRS